MVTKSIDIGKAIQEAVFETDALQQEAIMGYLRDDEKFRRLFNKDLTGLFYQYIDDKIRLREPITINVKGSVRSGKSTIAITIACRVAERNGKQLTGHNICANEFSFLDKVKTAEDNDVFVIDESKEGVFGVGSMAKKMKINDIQNIIAKKNISTIWITPRRFNDTNSDYGLQTLGRARNVNPRLVKLLLYNLLDKSIGSIIPFGYVIMPIFDDVYPYGEKLRLEYEAIKDEWIEKEKDSDTNVMFDIQKERALELINDRKFLSLDKIKDMVVFAKSKLPSEFTKQEVEEIVRLAKLINDGIIPK